MHKVRCRVLIQLGERGMDKLGIKLDLSLSYSFIKNNLDDFYM